MGSATAIAATAGPARGHQRLHGRCRAAPDQRQPARSISITAAGCVLPMRPTLTVFGLNGPQAFTSGSGSTPAFAGNSKLTAAKRCWIAGRGEPLEEADRLGAVLRVLRDAAAGDVDVRALARLVGPEDLHREVLLFVLQPAEVVAVRDADVALAGGDRLEHQRVVRERLGGEVPDPGAHHALGRLLAHVVDEHRDQRLVVDRLAAAQAQLALPARVAERGVGREVGRASRARSNRRSCARARRGRTSGPPGSRRCAGMAASSIGDFTGCRRPACVARQRSPASTVMKTSAGLFAPSAVRRWISGAPSSVTDFTSMPRSRPYSWNSWSTSWYLRAV